jgi:transposase
MKRSDFSVNDVGPTRFAAVTFIENCINAGFTLSEALLDAASRTWGDPPTKYSKITIKRWRRMYKKGGLSALNHKTRSDKGVYRCIPTNVQDAFLNFQKENPYMPVMRIVRQLEHDGLLLPGSLSRSTWLRFSSNHGLSLIKKTNNAKKHVRSSHPNQDWMLRVMQGDLSTNDLCNQLAHDLAPDDVSHLHRIVLTKSLRKRNKCMTILGHFKGIPNYEIVSFLYISKSSVSRYIARFLSGGIDRLIAHVRIKGRKITDKRYKDTLFSILHAPPSDYGYNRTTWRLLDLKAEMQRKRFPINKGYISRIIRDSGYTFYKARKQLTSRDPEYKEKLKRITGILSSLGKNEKFFSIDEYGPFSVRSVGGRHLAPQGKPRTIPQYQKSKGSLICTAALELSTNQITHFFSANKNTDEMIKLMNILLKEYKREKCIYLSWDAASWHVSKKLYKKVEAVNEEISDGHLSSPIVELAPLPAGAQFLNVIESVFSGMARAIIHNSDYESVEDCIAAINRHFKERNQIFRENPKRAGKKIWGKEQEVPVFKESNNCKDPHYR